MSRYKKIEASASWTQESLEEEGAVVIDHQIDTVAEAKRRAKYFLTEEYWRSIETSGRLLYSWVEADGVVIYDFFHKDHPRGVEC